MTRTIRIVFGDLVGLARVCGIGLALRWLMAIALNAGQCLRRRDLQAADRAMGTGPFTVRLGPVRAKLRGEQVVSGIREIWVRDVYLGGGKLSIPECGVVVDLGANMGNFTILALAHGLRVRCVAVEGDARCLAKLNENIAENHWQDRVTICSKFIGGATHVQERLQRETGGLAPDRFISERDFVDLYGLKTIDLLKCDIEGSEFELLRPGSHLLTMSRQLAIELHSWGGDIGEFIEMLIREGFKVVNSREAKDDAIVLARRLRNEAP